MSNPWDTAGIGLGRMRVNGAAAVVLTASDFGQAAFATVEGRTFTDLPDLLAASDGDSSRIRPGDEIAVDNCEVLSPVGRPGKIICVGQNYRAHIAEGGRSEAPPYPDLFVKWVNTLSAPGADIPLPRESEQIDYESELAIVIGRRGRRVPAEKVGDFVFGYTAANDGSVRDFQFHTSQRTAGKVWDALTPLGPVVVPAVTLGGVHPDLRITGLFNGEIVQDDRTSSMILRRFRSDRLHLDFRHAGTRRSDSDRDSGRGWLRSRAAAVSARRRHLRGSDRGCR